MLRLPRNRAGLNLLKIFIFAETALFGGSYLLWSRMNKDRTFRKYMNDNYPSILDGYYTLGETIDSTNQARAFDSSVWEAERRQDQ